MTGWKLSVLCKAGSISSAAWRSKSTGKWKVRSIKVSKEHLSTLSHSLQLELSVKIPLTIDYPQTSWHTLKSGSWLPGNFTNSHKTLQIHNLNANSRQRTGLTECLFCASGFCSTLFLKIWMAIYPQQWYLLGLVSCLRFTLGKLYSIQSEYPPSSLTNECSIVMLLLHTDL